VKRSLVWFYEHSLAKLFAWTRQSGYTKTVKPPLRQTFDSSKMDLSRPQCPKDDITNGNSFLCRFWLIELILDINTENINLQDHYGCRFCRRSIWWSHRFDLVMMLISFGEDFDLVGIQSW